MASDLEGSLIEGGISPAAAKIISNAISNLATGRLNIGRQLEDATPVDRMRLIDPDTRRYVLTNLDYPSATKPTRRDARKAQQHPYQDSQPATSNPTIATPGVKAGKFVAVGRETTNEVSQAEVSLNVKQMGGQHARLNPGSGAVEAVPISIEFEPKGLLEGEVVEEAGKTVIKVRVISTMLLSLLKKKLGNYSSIKYFDVDCVLRVNNKVIDANEAFLILPE